MPCDGSNPCSCPEGFCVSLVSNGYATTTDGSIVTASSSASACSDVNYEDAWFKALTRSQQQAHIEAKNSANIIDQTIDIMTTRDQEFQSYVTFQKAILQNYIEVPIINNNITCDYSKATIFKVVGNQAPFTVTLTNFVVVPSQTIYCLLILVDNAAKPNAYPSELKVVKENGLQVTPTLYYNPSKSSARSIVGNISAPNKLSFQFNLYPLSGQLRPYATVCIQTFTTD